MKFIIFSKFDQFKYLIARLDLTIIQTTNLTKRLAKR